jgi:hypothetical protein
VILMLLSMHVLYSAGLMCLANHSAILQVPERLKSSFLRIVIFHAQGQFHTQNRVC